MDDFSMSKRDPTLWDDIRKANARVPHKQADPKSAAARFVFGRAIILVVKDSRDDDAEVPQTAPT